MANHPATTDRAVRYRTVKIDNLDIFYREAGGVDKPTILLLHGFPTSSHMFRNLIPMLAENYHVIAPDYPGYGHSSMPLVSEFEYSFDNLAKVVLKFTEALNLKKFSLYVMDYGAPIGYRIASQHPEKIQAIIVQNGNAYDEGLDNDFWKPFRPFWKNKTEENAAPLKPLFELAATKWQYHTGVLDIEAISPDAWMHDQAGMDRPGNKDIQLELFYSYGTNSPLYPKWQEYFRTHQPPMLIVWGKNDQIFPAAGAEPYKRDLKNLEYHLLDTGHFALEDHGEMIGNTINQFLARVLPTLVGASK
ncbi:MAG: alpha/beta hydrolase [Cyanobacteria bacterium SZAS LIN-3]|nr:alpha/beta hydrolase [Cyanobacteria bacterium SZAS LIN-3]MBS2009153.1 alpha/beta hydrolase [Cyanobacteria bacterium SZAS TMP-1]